MKGAIISLSVSWRLPVVFSEDPEDTLLLFKLMAEQSKVLEFLELPRPGYKPKRLITRKLYVLKGLPGVGPKTAKALLNHFGSVEKVMHSTKTQLVRVAGIGPRKADEIRKVLGAERED
jgi:Fanconi anemia group M protein